jgi:hypothetical protein
VSIEEWKAKIDAMSASVEKYREAMGIDGVDPVAADRAANFAHRLQRSIAWAGLEWHEPHFSTDGDGNVEMSIRYGERELCFLVGVLHVAWMRVWGFKFSQMDDGYFTGMPGQIAALWRWLLTGEWPKDGGDA